MTRQHEASRTLVKSPPELWAECSDAASLARHLGEFGPIRITRLEPETTIAWEGENASGMVRIEPSGWGTRVTLTAKTPAAEASAESSAAKGLAGAGTWAEAEESAEVDVVAEEGALAESVEGGADESPSCEEVRNREVALEPDPVIGPEARGGLRAWLRLRFWDRGGIPLPLAFPPRPAGRPEPEREPPPPEVPTEPPAPPTPEAEVELEVEGTEAEAVLTAALDSLGQAHHRPYSRA